MIDGSGHPTASPGSQEDTTMLKTISAALLAVSVLAVAPAMAAGHGRTTHAPVFGSVQLKPSVLNAHARMGRHHHRHHHHHRYHHHHRVHHHH
jgi:hypothetical protein